MTANRLLPALLQSKKKTIDIQSHIIQKTTSPDLPDSSHNSLRINVTELKLHIFPTSTRSMEVDTHETAIIFVRTNQNEINIGYFCHSHPYQMRGRVSIGIMGKLVWTAGLANVECVQDVIWQGLSVSSLCHYYEVCFHIGFSCDGISFSFIAVCWCLSSW